MKVFTDYLIFNTKKRQDFVRITDDVAGIVDRSGVREGMALVSAMHITAGVYVNDWEEGLRSCCRSRPASSISVRGSRCSTPSSTASGRSA